MCCRMQKKKITFPASTATVSCCPLNKSPSVQCKSVIHCTSGVLLGKLIRINVCMAEIICNKFLSFIYLHGVKHATLLKSLKDSFSNSYYK